MQIHAFLLSPPMQVLLLTPLPTENCRAKDTNAHQVTMALTLRRVICPTKGTLTLSSPEHFCLVQRRKARGSLQRLLDIVRLRQTHENQMSNCSLEPQACPRLAPGSPTAGVRTDTQLSLKLSHKGLPFFPSRCHQGERHLGKL